MARKTVMDWVGHKITQAVYTETGISITLDDGSIIDIGAYIEESPSSYWDDEAKLFIEYKDKADGI